ncbi:MAG: Reversal of tor2 lethality [Trichoglossum hirsutum]|nr:MAG: Reversal of tor2 lethality [Trichoglossum hirsutum]
MQQSFLAKGVSVLTLSYLIYSGSAAVDPRLTGTWSTKSNAVITGPDFYDPVHERFIEPSLTGISYSFTEDGFYEEAYYRAISNPTSPQCPQGLMQFQHGTYVKADNGSLTLTPFAIDGRQLLSTPCKYQNSIYTRWNVTELIQRYEIYTDPYRKMPRLDLFGFDGAPMNPMYLAHNPPKMHPTITMNPLPTATGAKSTGSTKAKRSSVEAGVPFNRNAIRQREEPIDADKWWWIGAGMTALGSIGYFCS